MSSQSKRNVNTYGPDGRLYQLEYAMKAMNHGTLTLGVIHKDSVILVSEKKLVNSFVKNPLKKHFIIDDHLIMGFSGLSGDIRTVIEKSRKHALRHRSIYNEQISSEGLLKYLCSLAMKFSEKEEKKIFSRPLGVSLLLASNDTKPMLYTFDPSGSFNKYKAKALGMGAEVADEMLTKLVKEIDNLSIEEAMRKVIKIVANIIKEDISVERIECVILKNNNIEYLDNKIKGMIDEIKEEIVRERS
ncbi:20S proteasome component [Spraguea lophii 42_110]|uniref:20S proteasome component n=1 Tax=Spraguea lophii (strain 42_110) TaxID=1358809 RepID=S7W5E4_SPRLO|nr:20S proteasome component [Spraguea lophii 42_110]